jgi:hypothetical protein
VQPTNPVDLSAVLASGLENLRTTFTLTTSPGAAQLSYTLTKWQAQTFFAGEDDLALSGDLTFGVALTNDLNLQNPSLETTIALNQLELADAPCREPCPTGQFARGRAIADTFASTSAVFQRTSEALPLPWLHPDPANPTATGDLKTVALSALGGWLAQMLVRERAGLPQEIVSSRREVAQGIYRLAWLLFFGLPARADPAALGASLQRLLAAWCDGLLWKGPQCCGDYHGVVIACAVVEGGTIQSIDVYGGRRYVVHYPLLEHWGAQFGIAPPDITVMHFFSKLCCVAALAPPAADQPNFNQSLVPLGGGFLAIGEPAEIVAKLKEQQKKIVAQRMGSAPEVIASALALIGSKPQTPPATNFTALILADFVAAGTVMLLLPA